jgi:hypothetical protein
MSWGRQLLLLRTNPHVFALFKSDQENTTPSTAIPISLRSFSIRFRVEARQELKIYQLYDSALRRDNLCRN